MHWDPVGLPLHPIFEIAPPRDRGGPFALTTWARVGGACRRPFPSTAPLGLTLGNQRPHGRMPRAGLMLGDGEPRHSATGRETKSFLRLCGCYEGPSPVNPVENELLGESELSPTTTASTAAPNEPTHTAQSPSVRVHAAMHGT